jgi:hypothetical protein
MGIASQSRAACPFKIGKDMNSISVLGCVEDVLISRDVPNVVRITGTNEIFSSDVWRKMEKYGVFANLTGASLERCEDEGEAIVESLCETATGYFLDKEGLEVPEEDLDMFLSDLLPEGGTLTIDGHYDVFDGCRIVSETTYLKSDGRILRQSERYSTCLNSGESQQIKWTKEISEHRVKTFSENSNIISLGEYRRSSRV